LQCDDGTFYLGCILRSTPEFYPNKTPVKIDPDRSKIDISVDRIKKIGEIQPLDIDELSTYLGHSYGSLSFCQIIAVMRSFPTDRPGYVYCVRRFGKTYYHLGSAPAGELSDRVQQLAQLEKNPKAIVLLGWVEVSDYVSAEQHLKEVFHLYKMEDDWFDFRASRTIDLKSLLQSYADLIQKFPLEQRLIDAEVKPEYDRSFGFFEALHQARSKPYYPDSPTPNSSGTDLSGLSGTQSRKISRNIPSGVYGMATAAIAIVSLMIAKGLTSPSLTTLNVPSPSTPIPSPSTPSPSTKNLHQKPQPTKPKTIIWSPNSEGAIFRSAPSGSDETELDFLPNGTSITLGAISDEWQEVILANGQRGWVSNSLIQE
jgi:hypothetical protein